MDAGGYQDFGRADARNRLMPAVTITSVFLLLVILLFDIVLKPFLDSTSLTECSISDVLQLIFVGSPARLPLDSWEPMMKAFDWLHQHIGENVYEAIFFVEHVKFQYPLTSLLPMEAMASVGLLHLRVYTLVNLILTCVTALGMGVLMLDLAARLGLSGPSDTPAARLKLAGLGVLATLGFFPVAKAFSVGQIQVWLNAAFVLSAVFYARNRRWAVGMLLGLSTLIKPQMSLFLLWALLRKEWRIAGGWAVVVAVGGTVTAMLYGVKPMLTYLDVLSFIGAHGEGYYSNQTLNGLLNRLLHNGNNVQWLGDAFAPHHPLVYCATLSSGLLFIGFGLLWRRHDGGDGGILSFAMAGICFTVGSPVAWIHHFGILLPAFAIAFLAVAATAADWPRAAKRNFQLLGVAFLLTGVDAFKPANALADTPFNILQSYMFFGTLILMTVLWRVAAPVRQRRPLSFPQAALPG